MQVLPIEFKSPEYHTALELRNRLLRLPLGLDVFTEDLEAERAQWHYGLYDVSVLIGCVIAVPDEAGTAKIRQMAIDTPRQGKGCGRILLTSVETDLISRGISTVRLHARVEAVDFYKKLGYQKIGGTFVEVGIAHQSMQKLL